MISVESLSKEYVIGGKPGGYRTLREAIMRKLMNPFEKSVAVENKFWALKDVSFEVQPGEIVGIIGRNGAGKSTLLKILSRITEPTQGRITLRGRAASLLEIGTGFHPELTGRENIYLNGSILGMKKIETDKKFDEIVAFAEVEKFIDTPVKHYSSGMYVRLAFAVAAHLDPEILLVDEVLAAGDAGFQKKCLGKMHDVSRQGRTVLFVSHSMGTLQQLCTRAVLLDKGEVQMDGRISDVIAKYLRLGLNQEGERSWPDLESAPGDGVVRFHSIRVLDAKGHPRTSFTVREPLRIEIQYQVLQECPLDTFLYLYDQLGFCLFVSIDNKDSPWKNGPRHSGLYRSVCKIPGDFLNPGWFSIHVCISQNLDKAIMHAEEKDAVWFTVSDSGDDEGVRGNFKYEWPVSIIRPRIEWAVEALDSEKALKDVCKPKVSRR